MVKSIRFDGKIHNFPDDVTEDEINQTLGGVSSNQKPEGAFSKLGSGIMRAAEDIDIGGNMMGRNLMRLLHLPGGQQTDEQIRQIWGQQNYKPNLADKILQSGAQYAPGLVLPGANIGKAGQALGSIPKIGGFLSESASQAIPQAAFGATQNENPLEGALEGAGGAAVGTAIGRGINALRPSKMFRGKLSPEELEHNLEVAKGTETGLGRLIESPTLMRLQENVLPHTIGAGAEKTMQRNAENITKKGEDIFNKMQGNQPSSNYGVELQNALKNAEKEARKVKNINYDDLNSIAEQHGINIGRQNFQNSAEKIINEIKQSPELEAELGKDLYNDLRRYAANKQGNTLKLTNIFRGKLGDKANELYIAGKKHESNLIKELKDSLDKDINSSFEGSGNPEVKTAYDKAQKEYRENYAPFEDKDIVKFTRQGGDPDILLSHFLRGGKNDRATMLQKLSDSLRKKDISNLSKETTNPNLISSAYFSQSMDESGKINPVKFSSLYQKLGKNQRKSLFNDNKLHTEIKNYSDLVNKNKESFNLMFNPKTGARNSEILSKVGQMVAGSTLGVPGIASLIASGISGKVLNKALTSEKFREKLINSMIKNKNPKLSGLANVGGASGIGYGNQPMELELVGGQKE